MKCEIRIIMVPWLPVLTGGRSHFNIFHTTQGLETRTVWGFRSKQALIVPKWQADYKCQQPATMSLPFLIVLSHDQARFRVPWKRGIHAHSVSPQPDCGSGHFSFIRTAPLASAPLTV